MFFLTEVYMVKKQSTVINLFLMLAVILLTVTNAFAGSLLFFDHNTHIFGKDDRQMKNTADEPFRYVGRLTFTGGICTAFVISKNHLLTAAHCVRGEVAAHENVRFQVDFGGRGFESIL